jgi:hypothetical protein
MPTLRPTLFYLVQTSTYDLWYLAAGVQRADVHSVSTVQCTSCIVMYDECAVLVCLRGRSVLLYIASALK